MVQDIDFDRMIHEGAVHIGHISLDSVQFEDYRDKNIPFNTAQRPKLYHTAVKGLPFPLRIDSITVHRSYIRYEELETGESTAGYVTLEDLSGSIRNITNDSSAIKAGQEIVVDGKARLMGAGDMVARIRLLYGENPDERSHGPSCAREKKPEGNASWRGKG